MRIGVNSEGGLLVKEVFSGLVLETEGGNILPSACGMTPWKRRLLELDDGLGLTWKPGRYTRWREPKKGKT